MKKIKLFLAACAAMLGVQTGFAQQEPVNGGVYYLYNTETGTFLTRGSNWGTKAVTNEAGQPWQVSISDGKYTLRMYDIVKSGSTEGLNGNFTDNDSPLAFTLTGSATGYTISNGSVYLTAPATYGWDVLVENASSNMTWQFLNVDDYKRVLAAKQTAQEAAIATAAGVTLGQSTLSDVVGDADNWRSQSVGSYTANKTDWNVASVPNRGGNVNEGSYGVEIYQGGGSFSRTLTGLKSGIYKVGIKAMFRSNTNGNGYAIGQEGYINSSAYLNANGYIVPIKDWYSSCASNSNPNSTGQFATIANNGGYYTEMFTYVGDAGTLALSAVSESYWGGSWFLFNSVTLTYYTDQIEDADITALVATIPTAIPTAAAENIASLRSTLESTKTIAAYNALNSAITAAQELVTPYAAYKVALENAQIAGVDEATITAQQNAVEQATTVSAVEAGTNALATAAASVEATDITAYTITNAIPTTNADGWTVSVTPNAFDSNNNNAEFWNQSAATMKQTITGLPAGSYRLTVVALQRDGCIGTIEAAGKTTRIVDVDRITANDRTAAATYFNNGNGLNYVYFTLDEASDVTIGINVDNTIDDHWTVFRSFALATYTESVAASYLKPGYDVAMAAAVAYQSQDMFDKDKTALNTAISENTVDASSATVALYESAIANLNAAATAAAAAVSNYVTYNAIVAAIGENTNVDLTSYVTNADFQLNNLTGWTSVDGGNVANNGNFNSTYFVERWKNNVALVEGSLTHDPIVLPAGVYRITADAQNIEQYNSNAGGTGLFLCANDEKAEIGAKGSYSVYIKVADKEALTIKFLQDNCTGNWVAYDNVTLTYVAADYVYAIVEGKMNADVAAAQTSAETAFNTAQSGTTYNTLLAAIANAQASKDAYAAAATAIAAAKALKDNHNFATAAATTTYAEAIAAIETPYNEGTLADTDANAAGSTLGVAVSDWHGNGNGAASNYMENGFGLNDFDAALYVNTWSTEGDNDGSGFSVPFYEYWTADANSLGEKTWTGNLTGLENGLYEVSAWVRVRAKDGTVEEPVVVTDATGITMNVNDGEAVDVTEGTQVGESRFVLGKFTAEGLVKGGSLTLNFNIAADNNISWLAFKNVKYTKVRDLTPEEAAIVPTAIALYNGEEEVTEPIVLDGATPSVTLSTVLSPEDATKGYIDWNSSDLSVATVNSLGEVTAVSTGTAIITATSMLDNTVSASVTVKSFAFLNGSFEADGKMSNSNAKLDAITGWTETVPGNQFNNTQIYDSETANASAFGTKVNPTDGTYYLFFRQGWCGSSTADMTMTTGNMTLPIGKYTISYDYMLAESTDKDHTSSGTKLTFAALDSNSETLNSATVSAAKNPGNSYFTNDANWASSSFVLTLTEETTVSFKLAMTPRGGVRSDMCVDNFRISYENIKEALPSMIADVTIPTSNVGTEAFQISSSAVITLSDAVDAAQEVYDNVETTEAQAIAAIEALENAVEAFEATPINEPADGQLFNVILTYDGWTYDNKAMTYIANGRNDAGLYNIQYKEEANTNLAQAFTFTKVEGNNYKMSQIDADGVARYICTGVPYSGSTGQIRTTTEADKALVVTVIPTATEGKWNLLNTEANQYIGSQDAGVFTVNSHIDFNIVETSKPSITINITAAGWGTTMLPFAVAELPEGVKAYTCAAVAKATLTLEEVTALEANKPYIIEGAWNETLTGDAQGTALNYTEGLLTGVYAATPAPEGSYVLQNNDSKVGFYLVAEGEGQQPTVGANRAYLSAPAEVKADAFFFDEGTATAIKSVFDGVAAGEVYDLAGRKLQKLQKGVNIVNGKKVLVK